MAHLSASNSELCSIIANKSPPKRPLHQSSIEPDGDKLVQKKPKPGLKGPTKMGLKHKTVSSRDFAGVVHSLPSSSTAGSRPIGIDQVEVMDDSVTSDDDDADSERFDGNFRGDDTGSLEHAEENYASAAPSTSGTSEAQNSDIPIIDLDVESDLPDNTSCDIPIIGEKPPSTWSPPPKAFAWFRKVADLGITDEQFRSLDDAYTPPDSVEHYFEPAKLPPAFWDSVRQNRVSSLKFKAFHKAQSYLTSAIKPLLSVLDSLDPSDSENRSRLAYAIQLLSTSNLQFNRLKRAMAVPHIRKEFRRSMLSKKITHNSLFGEDFTRTSELALKDVASSSKILYTPQPFCRPFLPQGRSNPGPSHSHTAHPAVSQASVSGRYNPYCGTGRGSSSFRGRSSGSGYRKKQ